MPSLLSGRYSAVKVRKILYVTSARYEADRANVPVRLLDLDAFVRHYVEVYDKADDETRGILPLTRIWWPA